MGGLSILPSFFKVDF